MRTSKRTIGWMSGIALAICFSWVGSASAIDVPDASFEGLAPVGSWTYVNSADTPWDCSASTGGAWIGNFYGNGSYYPQVGHDGTSYVDVNGYYVYQTLAATYEAGQKYILTVWAATDLGETGQRLYGYFTDGTNTLFDSGPQPIPTSTVTFTWYKYDFTYTATSADAGKNIGIQFWADGDSNIDDISLIAEVLIVESTPDTLNLDEEGATSDTYEIVLTYEPNADGPGGGGGGDTVIIVCEPNGLDVNGKPEDINIGNGPGGSIKLTFTSANWNVPQTVTVNAIDDSDIEGDHTINIKQYIDPNALPADPNYANTSIGTISVNIADNDVPVVTITETDGYTYVEEGGTGDSYEVSLSVLPTADVPVTIKAGIIMSQVTAGSDDAEENATTGAMSLDSSDLELVTDGTTVQKVGVRFTNISIPQGATIQKAYLQFSCDETINANPCNLTIYGEAADNAATFTTTANDISNRTKTAASVAWNPSDWMVVGEAGANQKTTELKTIVQAIVNQGGWSRGNALAFIITGTGRRTADAYEDGAALAPKLYIEYVDSDIQINGAAAGQTVTLTFTTINWATPQTVTVTAAQDLLVEGDHSTVIAHTVGGTSQYAVAPVGTNPAITIPVPIPDVIVYIGDDDGQPALEDNLVMYLPFDGDTADRSGLSNNGLAVLDPNAVSGKIGGALDFNGTADITAQNYVTCGLSDELKFGADTDFSVAAWIKMTTLADTDDGAIMSDKDWNSGANNGWVMDVGENGRMEVNIGDGSNREDYDGPADQISMNEWHLLAVSYDRNGLAVYYLDGVPVGTDSMTADPIGDIDSGLPTVIGADGTFSTVWEYFFDGSIDEPAIWARAITMVDVQKLWNGGDGTALALNPGLRIIPDATDGGDPVGGSRLTVEEGASSDTYTVELNSLPTDTVTVVVESNDPNVIVVGAPITLTFTTGDWNVPQTVTVQADDDLNYDGSEPVVYKVTHTASSGDTDYDGFVDDMDVVVVDDDVPHITVDPVTLEIFEGESETYTVVLDIWPTNETGTVTVTVDPNNGAAGPELDLGGGFGTPIVLTFNSGNFSTPQTITVDVAENTELTADRAATITHTADSSVDGDYEGADIDSVAVTVKEDECGFWGYKTMDFNKDCTVDLVDLSEFLSEWLSCTQTYETGCLDKN